MTEFKDFNIPTFLLDSLKHLRITTPTPIQLQAIPPALEGGDILASAQTGTGKTIAYLIPLLTNLLEKPHSCALILTPTRELAAQVEDAALQLLGKKPIINTALIIGGASMGKQHEMLQRKPRLIIGTPGRINDHLRRRSLNLKETQFLVLDETDRMLDMGFSEDLDKIVGHLSSQRQTFMFSATIPDSIIKISQKYLQNPQRIAVGSTTQPVAKIDQKTIQTSADQKFSHLVREVEEREGSIIIFVKTKIRAEQISHKLKDQNHKADAIHGDLRQRRRDQVIKSFRNQKSRIMVATDIAARGLDIPHVMHVINYDLPQCPEDYIHRIGRTSRAGAEGFALSLIAPEDNGKWRAIHRLIYNENPKDMPRETKNPQGQKKHFRKKFTARKPSSFKSSSSSFKPKRQAAGR